MTSPTTLDFPPDGRDRVADSAPVGPALVLLWSAKEPERAGEVLSFGARARGPWIFGRGPADEEGPARVVLVRQRPGSDEATPPIGDPFVSRTQWRIDAEGDGLAIATVGRRALVVRGAAAESAVVQAGDFVELEGRLLFLCVRRPLLAPLRHGATNHAFGGADAHGIVGEAPATWALRDVAAFTAGRHGHVLITGGSGTGKELVAHAIHAQSPRAAGPFVARNAATIPSGLIDAELFGNVAGYPNPGMPERPGLVGEAHKGTLFLDEIGEMPPEAQAHLLRVADTRGEYQRLGDAKRRTSDLRIIAATNRPPEALKHDVLARFPLRVHVPDLADRREDIPVLARHLLRVEAARDEHVRDAFFSGGAAGEPRLSLALVQALAGHGYGANVRELMALLWRAISTSPGATLELTDAVREELDAPAEAQPARDVDDVSADEVRAALAKHHGVRERAWRELGLSSRHVLNRLMKRHGIEDA
jgi:two-component system nitrogen regulation response regulator GlnG/two-component system response regulator HydG